MKRIFQLSTAAFSSHKTADRVVNKQQQKTGRFLQYETWCLAGG